MRNQGHAYSLCYSAFSAYELTYGTCRQNKKIFLAVRSVFQWSFLPRASTKIRSIRTRTCVQMCICVSSNHPFSALRPVPSFFSLLYSSPPSTLNGPVVRTWRQLNGFSNDVSLFSLRLNGLLPFITGSIGAKYSVLLSTKRYYGVFSDHL